MKKIMYGLLLTLIGFVFLAMGCEEDKNSGDGTTLALLIAASGSMGCYYQGDCDTIPSTFVRSESLTADDCDDSDGFWTLCPTIDLQCHTGKSSTVTVLGVTTVTYELSD